MSSASYIISVAGISTSAVVGSLGNLLTLYTLWRSEELRNTLGATARLFTALALNDFCCCSLGMGLFVWNMAVGHAGPFENYAFCLFSNLYLFTLARISFWYLWALAVTRFSAVFAPKGHSRRMDNVWVKTLLVLWPVALGASTKLGGFFFGYYDIGPQKGTGTCNPKPVSFDAEGIRLIGVYKQLAIYVQCYLPVSTGFLIYFLVFARLYYTARRTSANQVAPVSGTGNAPSTTATITTKGNANSAAKQRVAKVRVLFAIYAVNMALSLPNWIVFASPWASDALAATVPSLRIWLWLGFFVAITVNPVVYAVVSADFRRAYRQSLARLTCGG